jgi:uncharacterized membrane protein
VDTPETIAAAYLSRHATVDIGSALSRGWALLKDHMGVLVGASLLAWIVSGVPIIGWLLGFVLLGSLDYMILRRLRGHEVQLGNVFDGFSTDFLNLVMAGIVKSALIFVGFLVCILPGIYLGVSYIFALPLVIDKKMEFWPAMEVSRRVVHEHWWSMFALAIVLALVACAGVFLCVIGLAITIPLASVSLMYVYEDLFGAIPPSATSTPPLTA